MLLNSMLTALIFKHNLLCTPLCMYTHPYNVTLSIFIGVYGMCCSMAKPQMLNLLNIITNNHNCYNFKNNKDSSNSTITCTEEVIIN